MRYYDIKIYDPKDNKILIPKVMQDAGLKDSSYTNFLNGQIVAGGLDVELQIRNFTYGTIAGAQRENCHVRIFGVSLPELGSSLNFYNYNIVVSGGMKRGLPLAKPEQSGVLISGMVFQALGNWEGIEKSLDLMIYADPNNKANNYQFVWRKGALLSDAIRSTLAIAESGFKVNMYIQDIRALKDYNDTCGSFEAFKDMIKSITNNSKYNYKTITGNPYAGVNVYKRPASPLKPFTVGQVPGTGAIQLPPPSGSDIIVTDETIPIQDSRLPDSPLELNIEDMVGQPVWIHPAVIRFRTVMRADILVGDFIKLPQKPFGSLYTVQTPASAVPDNPSRNRLAFQSSFLVSSVTHFGRLRQADPSSWITTYEATFTNSAPSQAAPQGTGVQGSRVTS